MRQVLTSGSKDLLDKIGVWSNFGSWKIKYYNLCDLIFTAVMT